MQEDKVDHFKETLLKIEHFYHIKEFKSFSQSKIVHLKQDKKFQPPDYYVQVRRMLLHVIYLYYVAYVKKKDFYLYPHLCIDKWGSIFRYYSLKKQHQNFMTYVQAQDFKQNIVSEFKFIWNIKRKEQEQVQQKQEQKSKNRQLSQWSQFGNQIVEIFDDINLTPKDIISKLEQTKHMKNNILILSVLSSTLFPCIRLNKSVQCAFKLSYEDQPSIIKEIFNKDYQNKGTKDFVNCIIGFLKVLNEFKILGITTTLSQKSNPKVIDHESLLTQFFITLGRTLVPKECSPQNNDVDDKNPTSNQSSEHDYSQSNEGKEMGQLKCQFFWGKRQQTRELTFRVSVFINKKIYPLYFNQIENIWYRLSEKWKVILDEDKQLSGFNPAFFILDYNKQKYQLSFTDYIRYQPMQHILSKLILSTDKLIIATLAMKEVICFYERKSLSVQINDEELVINDGRLQHMAKSICQSIKNYFGYCKKVMMQMGGSR